MSNLFLTGGAAVLNAYRAHRQQYPLPEGWAEQFDTSEDTCVPVRLENANYLIDLRMREADEWETDEDFRAYTAYVVRKDQVAPEVHDAIRTVQSLLGDDVHVETRYDRSDPYDGVHLDEAGKPANYLLIGRPSSDFLKREPPPARLMLPLSIQFPPIFHCSDHGKVAEDGGDAASQLPREVQDELPEADE